MSPFVAITPEADLASAAEMVVSLRREGHGSAALIAAVQARLGISASTARRLFDKPPNPRGHAFGLLLDAAESRVLDELQAKTEQAEAVIELSRVARTAPERAARPEQGRILAPARIERPVAPGFEKTDPRTARERLTGLDDVAFERMQRNAFALEDSRRAGYKMHEAEVSIVATRRSTRTARDGYSTAELLAQACR